MCRVFRDGRKRDGSEMDLEVDSGANVAAVAAEGTYELGSPLSG